MIESLTTCVLESDLYIYTSLHKTCIIMALTKFQSSKNGMLQKCWLLITGRVNNKISPQNNNNAGEINRNINTTECIDSELWSTGCDDQSFFDNDTHDTVQSQALCKLLQCHLHSETCNTGIELLFPMDLLNTIAKHIVQISKTEPCGLRGCSLFIDIQHKSTVAIKIDRIQCDPYSVPTFELHLTLTKDKKRWHKFKELLAPVLPGFRNKSKAIEVYIKSQYKLVKNKLYRAK